MPVRGLTWALHHHRHRPSATAIVIVTAQRSSKTHQNLVKLPSDPQPRPLPAEQAKDDAIHSYEMDMGVHMREDKSATERMTKAERRQAGRCCITAYWLTDGFRMKLLASFLKREHNVIPRSFDNSEALYIVCLTTLLLLLLQLLPPPLPISESSRTCELGLIPNARCTTPHCSPATAPRPKCAPRCRCCRTPAACHTCHRSKRTATGSEFILLGCSPEAVVIGSLHCVYVHSCHIAVMVTCSRCQHCCHCHHGPLPTDMV